MEETLLWLGAFVGCKVRNLHQVKSKLNRTGNHSILQHRTISSVILLVIQEYVLMQAYEETLPEVHKKQILQLMSWPAQTEDLYPFKLVWDDLDWKVRAHQPTSAAHQSNSCWKSWQNYLQSSSSFGGKISENQRSSDSG